MLAWVLGWEPGGLEASEQLDGHPRLFCASGFGPDILNMLAQCPAVSPHGVTGGKPWTSGTINGSQELGSLTSNDLSWSLIVFWSDCPCFSPFPSVTHDTYPFLFC